MRNSAALTDPPCSLRGDSPLERDQPGISEKAGWETCVPAEPQAGDCRT
jgi:hypothetical protein